MKSSKDIKDLAIYICTSSKVITKETGKRRFFIPFFKEKVPELFKRSVVMSSLCLNLTSLSDPLAFNTDIGYIYRFDTGINTDAIPMNNKKLTFASTPNSALNYLVEHSTGINILDTTTKFKNVFKEMNISNENELMKSFSTNEVQKLITNSINSLNTANTYMEFTPNKLKGNGGFIGYGKV